jgi:hypothetical protein
MKKYNETFLIFHLLETLDYVVYLEMGVWVKGDGN